MSREGRMTETETICPRCGRPVERGGAQKDGKVYCCLACALGPPYTCSCIRLEMQRRR